MTYFDGSDTLAHRFWLMRQSEEEIRTRLRNQDFDPDIAAELKERFGKLSTLLRVIGRDAGADY